MKNIEKLRANSLALVEAKYMADEITRLVCQAESLGMALPATARHFRLELAQEKESSAKRDQAAAVLRLQHLTLLRRIREWESINGRSHMDLLNGKETSK